MNRHQGLKPHTPKVKVAFSLEEAPCGSKGLLHYERLRQFPPKSHSLVYLLNEIGIKPPEEPGKFIFKLSEASIPTRYPEDLAKLQQDHTENIVKEILVKGKEVITWIKRQL